MVCADFEIPSENLEIDTGAETGLSRVRPNNTAVGFIRNFGGMKRTESKGRPIGYHELGAGMQAPSIAQIDRKSVV